MGVADVHIVYSDSLVLKILVEPIVVPQFARIYSDDNLMTLSQFVNEVENVCSVQCVCGDTVFVQENTNIFGRCATIINTKIFSFLNQCIFRNIYSESFHDYLL